MRPSVKEINSKIKTALRLCQEGKICFVDNAVIVADLLELDLLLDEFLEKLPSLFKEIKPADYVGGRPPQKSYKEIIRNCELFAFRWYSQTVGCKVYIKFCIKGTTLYIVSFHKDRSQRGRS